MQKAQSKTSLSLAIKNKKTSDIPLSLSLSSIVNLCLYSDSDTIESLPKSSVEKIHSFFSVNEQVGLLRLGLSNFDSLLPASFTFWQQFSKLFITKMCKTVDLTLKFDFLNIAFPTDEINALIAKAPPIRGIEYLNQETAFAIWQGLATTLKQELIVFVKVTGLPQRFLVFAILSKQRKIISSLF